MNSLSQKTSIVALTHISRPQRFKKCMMYQSYLTFYFMLCYFGETIPCYVSHTHLKIASTPQVLALWVFTPYVCHV